MRSLKDIFRHLASPFFSGKVIGSEVTGTYRNRFNVTLDDGHTVNCYRHMEPMEGCDIEGFSRDGVENPRMTGLAWPLKDENGAQKLIFAKFSCD